MAKVERRMEKRSTSYSQSRGQVKDSSKAPMFRFHKKFRYKVHHGSPSRSFNGKSGKSLIRQPEVAQCSSDNKIRRLLFVRDHTTSIRFLVDSEAQISIIPATEANKKKGPHKFTLEAVNKSLITTYSQRCLTFYLGLRRASTHILLLLTWKNPYWVQIFYTNIAFSWILTGIARRIMGRTLNHLGRCVKDFSYPLLWLAWKRIQYFANFQKNLQILPNRLYHRSPGLYGDYRARNSATKPDRYSIPHIHDVTAIILNKFVFTKLDLIRAYHQIPVEARHIPKTAITTPFGCLNFYACLSA